MANKSDIELRNFFTQIDKDGKYLKCSESY